MAIGLTTGTTTTTTRPTTTSSTWTGRLNTAPPSLVTWLVDGNNLQCSRFVPNERQAIIEELQKIASPNDVNINADDDDQKPISNVFLVFDGDEEESFLHIKSQQTKWFQYVITDGEGKQKDRADDFIVNHAIPELQILGGRVHLVSADKELGKRVTATGVMKGGSLVHPPKFWQKYLGNLQAKAGN